MQHLSAHSFSPCYCPPPSCSASALSISGAMSGSSMDGEIQQSSPASSTWRYPCCTLHRGREGTHATPCIVDVKVPVMTIHVTMTGQGEGRDASSLSSEACCRSCDCHCSAKVSTCRRGAICCRQLLQTYAQEAEVLSCRGLSMCQGIWGGKEARNWRTQSAFG